MAEIDYVCMAPRRAERAAAEKRRAAQEEVETILKAIKRCGNVRHATPALKALMLFTGQLPRQFHVIMSVQHCPIHMPHAVSMIFL